MNTKIEDYNFSDLKPVKKRCIYFGPKGNQVMEQAKNLYCVEDMTGNAEHRNLFIENITATDSCNFSSFFLYDDLKVICLRICAISGHISIDGLAEALTNYQFWGVDGFFKRLEQQESKGSFVNILDIRVLTLLGKYELAIHYTEYRIRFLEKQKLIEEQRMKEDRQREEEKAESRRKQILREIEDVKNAIRNKETVYNRVLDIGIPGKRNSSIILYMMKQYGIKLPLKTQGWVNQALHKICFEGGKISYYYYKSSKNSTVFHLYLSELEEKVLEEGKGGNINI